MTDKVFLLRAPEVWQAVAAIDPVAVLAEDLIGRTIARAEPARRGPGRLVPWSGPGGDEAAELVALDHPSGTALRVLPATSLRVAQSATLAALAARELLVPGGVTVAMLGVTGPVQEQLAVITRHVPDISHVALWVGGRPGADPGAELLDHLDLSGIGHSVAPSAADAMFGANLVVAGGDGTCQPDLDEVSFKRLARGTVLVNATGLELPLDGEVDQVYVDDLSLLSSVPARRVADTSYIETTETTTETTVAGDLGQLLTGRESDRRRTNDIVLVDLLGVEELNVELAYRICQAAQQRGLGVQILTDEE